MPYEIDDLGVRLIGYNVPIEFYDGNRVLQCSISLQPDNTLSLCGVSVASGLTAATASQIFVRLDGNNWALWQPATGTQSIVGSFNLSTTSYEYKIGGAHALSMPGTNNLLAGAGAGAVLEAGGTDNTILGYGAGAALTTQDRNVIVGSGAGGSTQSADSVLVGTDVALNGVSCSHDVIIGDLAAGGGAYDGQSNVILGADAALAMTTGTNNVIAGFQAALVATSAFENVFLGSLVGWSVTLADQSVFVGGLAGYQVTDGSYNVLVGYKSGYALTTTEKNVFIGFESGYFETGGSKLFIDNARRGNEADARIKALVYGIFDAATANQYFTINGHLSVLETGTFANEGLHLLDLGGDHDLIIKPGTDLSADRIFTITTGDAARTLSMGGNFTINATTSITGGGALDLATFTLTVPATGTATLGTGAQWNVALWSDANTVKALGALGAVGEFLGSAGPGADPVWAVPAGGGVGPGTAGRVAQFAAGGVTIEDSNIVPPANLLTLIAGAPFTLTVPATGTAALLNQSNSFTLINPLITIAESWIGPSALNGVYFKGGDVGFGTNVPGYKVDVVGSAMISGRLGVGVAPNVDRSLNFLNTVTTTDAGGWYGIVGANTIARGANDAASFYIGGTFLSLITDNFDYTDAANGLVGMEGGAQADGTGTVTRAVGVIGQVRNSNAAGTITNAYAIYGRLLEESGDTTNYTGLYLETPNTPANITNLYGIYIGNMTGAATLNYAIRTHTGTVRFGDNVICDAKVGIGTLTPGSNAYAKLEVYGTDASANGPHTVWKTDGDAYPLFQMFAWEHDNVSFFFDAYYDGSHRSSDAGSNARIMKFDDVLRFRYDSGVNQGNLVTWNDGFVMDLTNGNVGIGGITDPDTTLEVYKVGTQLKLSGGAADYATFAVAADGAMTITTVDADAALADIIFAPDGVVISNANINITGMMRQTATWHAYGGFEDQAETIACGVGDWNLITNAGNNLWTLDEADGITEAADVFTITNTGDYAGVLSLSISAINGKDFHVRVYNNTQARVEGRAIGISTTGAGNEMNVCLPIYIDGTAADAIQFEIMSADGTDPVVDDGLFYLTYLHD